METPEDQIDMETLRRCLDPYILAAVLADRPRLESIRKHLAEAGSTALLSEETRTGYPHYFTLRDIR